jgi:hypothetical protein
MLLTFVGETTVGIDLGNANLLPSDLAILAIVLLIALLIGKVLLEAYDSEQFARATLILNLAITPLLIVFGIIFVIRVASLLNP